MKRKTSAKAVALIKKHEGLRLAVYKDAVGLKTIGYGHLLKKGERFRTITQSEASTLLKADIAEAEAVIAHYVKAKLNSHQHGALVSWVFNLGARAFRTSTLLKRVNGREFHRVPGEMMRWVLAGGRPLKGLIRRRADEAELFIL